MHAVSLFGCSLRQGHRTLPSTLNNTEDSYTKQVHSCWKYWQHKLAPDETRQLVHILSQPHDPAQAARRFQERFKQFAVAREVDSAISHLSGRISHNGWALGPPLTFWSGCPKCLCLKLELYGGALGEDPDLWLPLRGRISRNSPCAWCIQSARTYTFGLHKGALCVNCIGPDPGEHVELPPEALAFLRQHAPTSPVRTAPSLSIQNCARDTKGPLGDFALTPCVLCQGGSNAIDLRRTMHSCITARGTPVPSQCTAMGCPLRKPPPINWRRILHV